ncbi:MAG: NAD(P)-dependent oxidoreductase, partial [Terriglobales bacterium]
RELADATLGLIGVGAIGREVARLALAFGMKLMAVRERPERGTDFLPDPTLSAKSADQGGATSVLVVGFEALDHVVAESDFVVLAAPVTPKTHAMINADRLKRMKPDAYLINISRGALVDEEALAAALRDRQIAGAALDVFDREPLPDASPLWDLPTLLITPHAAALTDKMWNRHYTLFADNLRRYLNGRPLFGVVDKLKGY